MSWSVDSNGTWTIGDIYTSPPPGEWSVIYPTAPNIYPDITIQPQPYPAGATGAVFQPLLPLPGTYEFEQLVDAVVKRISEGHPEVTEDAKSRRKIKKAVGRMLRPVK
jgi:hypothetical protein